MKKFISKNWKKILITLGVIAIIINLGFKFIQKTNVVENYLENGPVVEKDVLDGVGEFTGDVTDQAEEDTDTLTGSVSNKTGLDPAIVKPVVMIVVGIAVIFILSAFLEKDGSGGKKK